MSRSFRPWGKRVAGATVPDGRSYATVTRGSGSAALGGRQPLQELGQRLGGPAGSVLPHEVPRALDHVELRAGDLLRQVVRARDRREGVVLCLLYTSDAADEE